MLGKLAREEQPNGSLDLPGGDCGPLVVVSKTASFPSDTLKDVIHERVHDRHSLGADTSIGVDLLEDLVYVDSVRFTPLPSLLLVSLGDRFLGLTGLLGGLSGCFWRHGVAGRTQRIMTKIRFFAVYNTKFA